METKSKYIIQTDIKFGALEKIDIGAIEKACDYDWFNQTLCRVNDSLVRLGIFKGEFHWHPAIPHFYITILNCPVKKELLQR